MVRWTNRRFCRGTSTRNRRGLVPLFALIALFLILGAAMLSKNAVGKSTALRSSIPTKPVQSANHNVENKVTTNPAPIVTTQQSKTGNSASTIITDASLNPGSSTYSAEPANTDLPGKYYMDDSFSDKFLELYSDGTFSLQWGSFPISGRWQVKETGVLILESDTFIYSGTPNRYEISTQGNNIVLIARRSFGELIWIKQ